MNRVGYVCVCVSDSISSPDSRMTSAECFGCTGGLSAAAAVVKMLLSVPPRTGINPYNSYTSKKKVRRWYIRGDVGCGKRAHWSLLSLLSVIARSAVSLKVEPGKDWSWSDATEVCAYLKSRIRLVWVDCMGEKSRTELARRILAIYMDTMPVQSGY